MPDWVHDIWNWASENPNFMWAFASASIFTIFLHWLLVYRYKIGEIGCKYLDYIWCIVLILGVILAYNRILERDLRIISELVKDELTFRINTDLNNLQAIANDCIDVSTALIIDANAGKTIGPDKSQFPRKSTDRTLEQFGLGLTNEDCEDLISLYDTLKDWRENPEWPIYPISQPSFTNFTDATSKMSKSAVFRAGLFQSERLDVLLVQIRSLRERRLQGSLLGWLFQNWYWVLAFAAAFRITKVAVEISVERRKRRWKRRNRRWKRRNEAI